MSKSTFITASARSASMSGATESAARYGHGRSQTLLPPAIKGITIGFVAGLVALFALMLLAPSLVSVEHRSIVENPTALKR